MYNKRESNSRGNLKRSFFYKLIKLIKGLKDHRYIKDKCKISLLQPITVENNPLCLSRYALNILVT